MQRSGTEAIRNQSQPSNGKYFKKQIVKIQREHMVNRVSGYFPIGGHSETQTELKIKPVNVMSGQHLDFNQNPSIILLRRLVYLRGNNVGLNFIRAPRVSTLLKFFSYNLLSGCKVVHTRINNL